MSPKMLFFTSAYPFPYPKGNQLHTQLKPYFYTIYSLTVTSWRKMRSCKRQSQITSTSLWHHRKQFVLSVPLSSRFCISPTSATFLWIIKPFSTHSAFTHTLPTSPRGQINISTSEAASLTQEHLGKSKDFKDLVHYVRSWARPFINPESATNLGTVKSTWLWEKRGREHTGTVVDGFATHSGIQHIPLSLVKGVSRAGFPFYFLSVVKCTSFHHPGHTVKCASFSSFLLEPTSWQHCSQPDRQPLCQTDVLFTVSLGWIPAPKWNYTLEWACWACLCLA